MILGTMMMMMMNDDDDYSWRFGVAFHFLNIYNMSRVIVVCSALSCLLGDREFLV